MSAMRWLALTGYMGAGKTAVGRRAARRLGWPFVDADRAVEAHAGMPIPEIFSRRGEVWFRRTEEAVIREILAGDPPGVIALGGGALGSERTRGLLGRRAWVVWLRADVEVAWGRVAGSSRPLAADRDDFVRRAATREPAYREAADLEVDADGPADEVAQRVVVWAAARAARGEGAASAPRGRGA
jgi:shikimate kinase